MVKLILLAAGLTLIALTAAAAPVHLVDEPPVEIKTVAPGVYLVDFGRVAFGNLRLLPPSGTQSDITVHFGEAFSQGRINRKPPGSVRYARVNVTLAGRQPVVAAPAADARNTRAPAVLTPPEWGVVLPFRWVEIEGWSGELTSAQLRRQAAFASNWDDQAAAFTTSDDTLNRIWDLCHYSIKATTFAGIYVDGDRERIPYEADAYLNQLGHFAAGNDRQMARDTFDRLMQHPTWPTEWAAHLVFMAHADYLRTADLAWLAPRYEQLKAKLLLKQARADGLIVSNEGQVKHADLVDWPVGERDGFVFKPVNTVINAFHLRTLRLMSEMASALKKEAEAADYAAHEAKAKAAFQSVLFDSTQGAYRDGEGTDHLSQHASLFPLAFDLVPAEHRAKVSAWVSGRGMRCSVYAAQYLLEGLFANEDAAAAIALITAPNDRSWSHMVDSGTTITWEAWDQKYKPNQDWNHAWGAAPANILPRFVLGVQTLAPGGGRVLIRPNPASLKSADGKIPSPKGPLLIRWNNDGAFSLEATLPAGVAARIELPAAADSRGVTLNGQPTEAARRDSRWILARELSGAFALRVHN